MQSNPQMEKVMIEREGLYWLHRECNDKHKKSDQSGRYAKKTIRKRSRVKSRQMMHQVMNGADPSELNFSDLGDSIYSMWWL